jgi:hypothetical protein
MSSNVVLGDTSRFVDGSFSGRALSTVRVSVDALANDVAL